MIVGAVIFALPIIILAPTGKEEARKRRPEGATLAELARSYHVGKSTISRLTA